MRSQDQHEAVTQLRALDTGQLSLEVWAIDETTSFNCIITGCERVGFCLMGTEIYCLECVLSVVRSLHELTVCRHITIDVTRPVQPSAEMRAYTDVIEALDGAVTTLLGISYRVGHIVRRDDASRASIIAGRCEQAVQSLKELASQK